MHDENGLFSEFGMDLWRNMSQDLNFNVMFSPRGIINLAHSDAQMNVYSRRGNSMRLNGIDAVLLNREEVKKIIPMADFSENVRFPIFGGLMQPSDCIMSCCSCARLHQSSKYWESYIFRKISHRNNFSNFFSV